VAAGAVSLGVETFGIHGVDSEGYERLLVEAIKCRPHIIIDAARPCESARRRLFKIRRLLSRRLRGDDYGILRLKARERDGILPCPMVAVNDAKAKHYYDNKYGRPVRMGWDYAYHKPCGCRKTVVVAGYGWCGKGVAMRAAGIGRRCHSHRS
jgi:adenosylhomocysteinase